MTIGTPLNKSASAVHNCIAETREILVGSIDRALERDQVIVDYLIAATDELNDDAEGFASTGRQLAKQEREKEEAERRRALAADGDDYLRRNGNRSSNPLQLASMLPTEEQRAARRREAGRLSKDGMSDDGRYSEPIIERQRSGGEEQGHLIGGSVTIGREDSGEVAVNEKRLQNPDGGQACCAACVVS